MLIYPYILSLLGESNSALFLPTSFPSQFAYHNQALTSCTQFHHTVTVVSSSEIKTIKRECTQKREKQRDGQKVTSLNYIDNCHHSRKNEKKKNSLTETQRFSFLQLFHLQCDLLSGLKFGGRKSSLSTDLVSQGGKG